LQAAAELKEEAMQLKDKLARSEAKRSGTSLVGFTVPDV
jgi:hypothetical protein